MRSEENCHWACFLLPVQHGGRPVGLSLVEGVVISGLQERANVLKGEVSDISDGSEDDLALGEVEKVEAGVKQLVAGAHGEEDRLGGVVQPHHWIPRPVNELVALGALRTRT